DGTLTYSFIESVNAMHPFYIIRFLGGLLYLIGALVMVYNLVRTCAGSQPVTAEVPAPATAH
ncbi:MAG: cytochrome C oxidase Cbb3, partial [Gammaproteobacteria bacterium]